MAEILMIQSDEAPSGYSSHVYVEEFARGAYRASGVCNHDGEVERFNPPDSRNLASIIKVATSWADRHGIHFVHVYIASRPTVRTE